jgi:hypothetical protein
MHTVWKWYMVLLLFSDPMNTSWRPHGRLPLRRFSVVFLEHVPGKGMFPRIQICISSSIDAEKTKPPNNRSTLSRIWKLLQGTSIIFATAKTSNSLRLGTRRRPIWNMLRTTKRRMTPSVQRSSHQLRRQVNIYDYRLRRRFSQRSSWGQVSPVQLDLRLAGPVGELPWSCSAYGREVAVRPPVFVRTRTHKTCTYLYASYYIPSVIFWLSPIDFF